MGLIMMSSTGRLRLHGFSLSGHAHRVQLFLSLLQLPYELIEVNLAQRAHKRAEFLALNSFGQVPVLEDGELVIADSNAILVYLARRYGDTNWLPEDAVGLAAVQRWLSVAAGPLAYGPAAARRVVVFKAPLNAAELIASSQQLFGVFEQTLQRTPWLAGTEPTIADIANYSYIAHAPEGNIPLEPYPHIRDWLCRIESLPGFVPMQASAVVA